MYYLGRVRDNSYHAGNKARKDCEEIFKKLKLKEIKINYFFLEKFSELFIYKLLEQSISLILNLKFIFSKPFLLFCQFPLERKWGYIFFFNLKNIKIVSIIHDLDGLRYKDEKILNKELKMLKKSKYIISHNLKMTSFLIENGIEKNKIKDLNIFDYLLNEKERKISNKIESDICFAGNLDKSVFIYKFKELKDIKIDVFGVNYREEKNNGDFRYCGAYPPDEIHEKLTGKYGLIWDGDSLEKCNGMYGEYMRYNNPHKLSLYIIAGLPVIVWKEAAIAKFVEKENIGITVDSLYELNTGLLNISKEEYDKKIKNVMKIREKIINGSMLTDIIKQILIGEGNE